MLGNFLCFFCRLLTFFKINFLKKKSFRNTIGVSNGLDPDQDRHSVGPDLGPKLFPKVIISKQQKSQVKQQIFIFSSPEPKAHG